VTAQYAGSGNDKPSIGSPVTLSVAPAATTVQLTVDKAIVAAGTLMASYGDTFSVKVAPVAPGGGLPAGTVSINGGVPLTLVNGRVNVSTGSYGVGLHPVQVVYNGSSSHLPSSADFTLAVVSRSPTLQLTAKPVAPVAGASVTLAASIAAPSATGTVQFFDGAVPIGAPVALVNNKATLKTTMLSNGAPHTVFATYSGDANNDPATSATVAVDGT
jgi:hypothetical protein